MRIFLRILKFKTKYCTKRFKSLDPNWNSFEKNLMLDYYYYYQNQNFANSNFQLHQWIPQALVFLASLENY